MAALAALALAASASAVPITFTGELNIANRPLGTSAVDAINSGLSIQAISSDDLDLLSDHGLTVSNELTTHIMNPLEVPFSATSDWSITNEGGVAGHVYLVVVSFDPTPVEISGMPEEIDYPFPEVGLDIDGVATPGNPQDRPWGFFEVDRTSVAVQALPLYLMMVDLGIIGIDESVGIDMHYYLEDPISFLDGDGFNVVLPKLQLMSVFTLIPEPGTGLLLVLGLGGLAFAGNRRE